MILKTLALSPILIPQALWTAARATRLPEAEGERAGIMGQGPDKSLLVLGDSSAAGVGTSHQSEALGGRLATELARHYRIRWQVIAQSGATVRSTLRMLDTVRPESCDFVLIALGVNDTKNGVSARRWMRESRDLLTQVSKTFSAPVVCVSGVPPLGDFPILPRPLNAVLGARSERFDAILREIVAQSPNSWHLPMDFPMDPANLAPDAFHPGPSIYAEWARRAASVFMRANGTCIEA